MPYTGTSVNYAHRAADNTASTLGVIGTLGTADTSGTALTLPMAVNPLTGAAYVHISGTDVSIGGAAGTFVNVVTGTQQTLGTVNIIQNAGTVQGGTIQNLAGGTVISPMPSGTLTTGTLQNLVSGTINALANGTISAGTVAVSIGTVGGAAANAVAASGNPNPVGGTDSGGTIRTILVDSTGVQRSTGTSVMSVGTLTTGTLQNLVSGTINALAAGTITGGTLQNLVSGTINSGTMVNNGGSLGTLNSGTVQVNMVPVVVGTSYGTVGTTGAAVWGTLVAASGAGTKQYVSGVDVVVVSGTVEVAVTNIGIGGSTGNGVLTRGNFVPGGGISKNFNPIQASGTNGTIAFWMGGAGTVDVTVQYWQGV